MKKSVYFLLFSGLFVTQHSFAAQDTVIQLKCGTINAIYERTADGNNVITVNNDDYTISSGTNRLVNDDGELLTIQSAKKQSAVPNSHQGVASIGFTDKMFREHKMLLMYENNEIMHCDIVKANSY